MDLRIQIQIFPKKTQPKTKSFKVYVYSKTKKKNQWEADINKKIIALILILSLLIILLQVNTVFTWKTTKLGHNQRKPKHVQPKKKLKVSNMVIQKRMKN